MYFISKINAFRSHQQFSIFISDSGSQPFVVGGTINSWNIPNPQPADNNNIQILVFIMIKYNLIFDNKAAEYNLWLMLISTTGVCCFWNL